MTNKTEEKTTTNILKDIRGLSRLWPYLKEDKKAVFIAIALIPVISVIQVIQPYLIKTAIDEGIIVNDQSVLMYYSIGFLIIVVLEYLSRTGQSLATSLAVYRMIVSLRNKTVNHVLSLKASYHDNAMSGALVTRATSDFDNLSESLSTGLVRSIVDLAVLIGCIVSMFLLDWRLALSAIVILPLTVYIIIKFSMALKRNTLFTRRKIATLNAYTQECLYGNATIKLLTARKYANAKYAGLNEDYRKSQMKVVVLDAFLFSVLDGISSIAIGIVLWVIVTSLFGIDNLSAGIMVAFIRLVQQLFEPLKQLGSTMAMLQGVFTAVERIFNILGIKQFLSGDKKVDALKGRVHFKDVSFSYNPERSKNILNQVNFTLEAGRSLALVGQTGSGKSTIIKLLSKQYEGFKGEITIDDNNIFDLDADSLRSHMAIVPQDIVLFNGSVKFNISLGIEGITDEDIVEAARTVGANQFIDRLPGGYDFKIKEQGSNLSHGQKQLIAFARALAKKPKLVILDEATSSVDPESEAAIQQAIANIFKNRSVVVIAHRLSTIRECDNIVVLDHGEVIEQGNHEQLMQHKGSYSKLHKALIT